MHRCRTQPAWRNGRCGRCTRRLDATRSSGLARHRAADACRDAFRRTRRALLCGAASNAYALLEERVARNPDGEAIVCGDARLTYRELRPAGVAVRGGLAEARRRRGDRVALLLGNDVAFPVVLFAALAAWRDRRADQHREQTPGLAYMLAHCGAKVLVHDADLADRLPSVACDAGPRASHRRDAWRRVGGLADLLDASRALIEPAAVDEEDTAVILYTSGHDRPAEGRHADPPRHLPLRHALRVLHGARSARPGRRSPCR